jgi:uncharacterized membrane protein YagU involved in acid resistance
LKTVYYPFALLAAIGFVASVTVHILSWLGVALPQSLMLLHIGAIVVPVVGVVIRSRPGYQQRDLWNQGDVWKAALATALVVYVILHFCASLTVLRGRLEVPESVEIFRIASGHWMLFYGAAMMLLLGRARG